MARIPFKDYVGAHRASNNEYSANLLLTLPEFDSEGKPVPMDWEPDRYSASEIPRLIKPYVSKRFIEQVRAVVPLALYLSLFQLLILNQVVEDSWIITGGLFAVIIGLMIFMEGLARGLMPFGEIIGSSLPRKSPLPLVLLITALLGIGVTFAEPAIGALQAAGQNISVERAPYLYALLNDWADILVLVVGVSVGLAAVLGTVRFLYGWSLKPLIYAALAPVLLVTMYCTLDPNLRVTLGLAWDAGAVTTGPVTVPLVLSLGIGIASASGRNESGLSGFGIVTLASLFPILGVMLLVIYVSGTVTPAEIIESARLAADAGQDAQLAWYERSPGSEIILGIRAIAPLVIFLFLVLKLILSERLPHPGEILYGIALTIIGLCIFNVGLTYGLSKLGGNAGGLIPAAFMGIEGFDGSPIYRYGIGLGIALAFAWFLGFGATVAEPALNALGITTEELTEGVFKKKTLVRAVSIGVACGISLGVVKLVFDLPLVWLIVPGYLVAIVLTMLSDETFVNVAWDSAGVTTGPITVPLVLAMGIGFGNATNAVEGFGILCMASIGPIITVMITGLWARFKLNRQGRAAKHQTTTLREHEATALL